MASPHSSPSSLLHAFYYYLFVYLEPFSLIFSLTSILLAPDWTMHTLFDTFIPQLQQQDKSIDHAALLSHPLTFLLLAMFFNMCLIVCGIQHNILPTLSYRRQQLFMFCLFYGDVLHLYFSYYYIVVHPDRVYGRAAAAPARSTQALSQGLHRLYQLGPLASGWWWGMEITTWLMLSRIAWYISGSKYSLRDYAEGTRSKEE